MQRFQHYIDGDFANGNAAFDSRDPATGTPWAQMPAATPDDVDRAVTAAERAFFSPDWALMTATARGKLLMRLADLVAENASSLAKLETRDTGKIIRETSAQIAYARNTTATTPGLPTRSRAHICPSTSRIWRSGCAANPLA